MGRLSDITMNAVLDALFGGTALPAVASYDIALSTTQPNDDGTGVTEPVGGTYARKNVLNDTTHWSGSVARRKSNALAVTFAQPTGSWGTVGWYAIYQGGTSTFVGWGRLATARAITASSSPPFFAPGTLVVNGPSST